MKQASRQWRVNPEVPTQVEANYRPTRYGYNADLLCEVESEEVAQLIASAPDMALLLEKVLATLTDPQADDKTALELEIEIIQLLQKVNGTKSSDTCPSCQSDNISNEGPEDESTCHDCSNQWTEGSGK